MGNRIPACDLCGARIVWAITEAGKRQALNPEPDGAGNTLAYRDATGTWRARSVTSAGEGARHPLERVYMPHAATCTGPKQLAVTRPPSLRPAPLPANVTPRRRRR